MIAGYEELRIEVRLVEERADGRHLFTTQVALSPQGAGPRVACQLPAEVLDALRTLRLRRLWHESVLALGLRLGDCLLPAPSREILVACLDRLDRLDRHIGLRLRLDLPPALSVIPWELVSIQRVAGPVDTSTILALDPRLSIVRHPAHGLPGPAWTRRPLRVALAAVDVGRDGSAGRWLGRMAALLDGLQTTVIHRSDVALERWSDVAVRLPLTVDVAHALVPAGAAASDGAPGDDTAGRLQAVVLQWSQEADPVELMAALEAWSGAAPITVGLPGPMGIGEEAWGRRFYKALAGGMQPDAAVTAARLSLYNRCHPPESDEAKRLHWQDWAMVVVSLAPEAPRHLAASGDDGLLTALRVEAQDVLDKRAAELEKKPAYSRDEAWTDNEVQKLFAETTPSADARPAGGLPAPGSETFHELRVVVTDVERRSDGAHSYRLGAPDAATAVDPVELALPANLGDRLARLERREASPEEIRDLGLELGRLILPGAVGAQFVRRLTALQSDETLRLRLVLPKELAWIPWEYVCLPLALDVPLDHAFLALNPRVSIVREEGEVEPRPASVTPRNLVAVLADPTGLLDLDQERRVLEDALLGLPWMRLHVVPGATMCELEEAVMQDVDIFHFGGHGRFEAEGSSGVRRATTGRGYICLCRSDGGEDCIPAEELQRNLVGRGVQMAVLVACETARRDQDRAWSSVVTALIASQIPSAVAMQYAISDVAAIAFTRRLYGSLAGGMPLDTAVTAARLAVFHCCSRGGEKGGDEAQTWWRDWGVPALYLQTEEPLRLQATSDPRETDCLTQVAVRDLVARSHEIKGGIMEPAAKPHKLYVYTVFGKGWLLAISLNGSVVGSYDSNAERSLNVVRGQNQLTIDVRDVGTGDYDVKVLCAVDGGEWDTVVNVSPKKPGKHVYDFEAE